MTSRASAARVCSPPDSAVGGLAHSGCVKPETRQRRVDALIERVAAEHVELVLEVGVGRVGDAARRLQGGQLGRHRLEMGRSGPDGGPQVRRGHERPRRSGPPAPAARSRGRACAARSRGRARRDPRRDEAAWSCRRRSGRPGRPGRRGRWQHRCRRGSRTCRPRGRRRRVAGSTSAAPRWRAAVGAHRRARRGTPARGGALGLRGPRVRSRAPGRARSHPGFDPGPPPRRAPSSAGPRRTSPPVIDRRTTRAPLRSPPGAAGTRSRNASRVRRRRSA